MDALMTAMLPEIKKQVLALIWVRVPGAKQVDKDAINKLFDETMDRMPSEFLKLAVPLYRQHFNKDEVAAMLKFYTSPEGRSIIEKLPAVTQQGQKLGAMLGQKLAKEGIERSRKELRSRGYKLWTTLNRRDRRGASGASDRGPPVVWVSLFPPHSPAIF